MSKWKTYERDGCIFSSLEPHMESMVPSNRRHHYFFSRFFAGFKGSRMYWVYPRQEFRDFSKKWLKKCLKEGTKDDFFKTVERHYQKSRAFLIKSAKSPLPENTDKLVKLYRTSRELGVEHSRMLVATIDGFDEYFLEFFTQTLINAGYGAIIQNPEAWTILNQPAYLSVFMKYEKTLLENSLKENACIQSIKNEYDWLSMGWGSTLPLSTEKIAEEIKKRKASSKVFRREKIAKIKAYPAEIRGQREKLLHKYNIPTDLVNPYLELLDHFALIHDQRKEIQMRVITVHYRLRRAIAKRYDLAESDLCWLKASEMPRVIKKGRLPNLFDRKIGYVFYANRGVISECEGKKAHKMIDKIFSQTFDGINQINGVSASPGKASGRAFVSSDPRKVIANIQKGDILICAMTTPDFVPALRRAAAIVTDEGGVTSHAAINSRELGIPCVTGTNFATKIFKTGDNVLVDAEKGNIKKI